MQLAPRSLDLDDVEVGKLLPDTCGIDITAPCHPAVATGGHIMPVDRGDPAAFENLTHMLSGANPNSFIMPYLGEFCKNGYHKSSNQAPPPDALGAVSGGTPSCRHRPDRVSERCACYRIDDSNRPIHYHGLPTSGANTAGLPPRARVTERLCR
jgi:hypothetical protein